DSTLSCDHDKVLDNSEVATLVITIRNTGARPLSSTKATVTSTNPNISFPKGNQVAVPATQPFETRPVFVNVALNGAAGIETFDLKVSVTDPALTPGTPVVKTLVTRGNFDTVLGSTT